MSIYIPSSLFPLEKKDIILKRLTFQVHEKKSSSSSSSNPPEITCMFFSNIEEEVFTFPEQTKRPTQKDIVIYNEKVEKCIEAPILSIPFWFAKNKCKFFSPLSFTTTNTNFAGTLREQQQIVYNQAMPILEKDNCCILGLYTGFGKTITSLFIASQLKLKTFIVVNRTILLNQWVDSINKFLPGSRIEILTSKTEEIGDCDFCIGTVQILSKFVQNTIFKDIGILIFDEVHTMASPTGLKSVHLFSPKYFMGLSATPKKQNTNICDILHFYFGNNIITRTMHFKYNVFKINTSITYDKKYTTNGRLDWEYILIQQARHEQRNKTILKIIEENKDNTILILCKRIEQVNILYSALKERKESVDKLISTAKKFNKDCRVLVSTYSKSGTGFDHDKLDMLIVASDVDELFIQYLGRVFRRPDVKVKIFDLVDDMFTLKKHWENRKDSYVKTGGTIIVKK